MSFMARFGEIAALVAHSMDDAEVVRERAIDDLITLEAFAMEAGFNPDQAAVLQSIISAKQALRLNGADVDDRSFEYVTFDW
ncbi:MAG: hypothetical protein AB8B83_05220 [Bdellovibrionales bacterium]